jgi:hypothetical protein
MADTTVAKDSGEERKLEYLWYDQKLHTITINNGAEDLDIQQVRETYKKIIEDKKDQCKSIFFLGAGLCGTYEAAHGFLLGWLFKSIRDDIAKKGETKVSIQHEEREISEDEAKDLLIKGVEGLLTHLKSSDGIKRKIPIIRGDVDGGELF